MSKPDYNIDNYTITELFEIIQLDDPTSSQIINTTNKYISRFTKENRPDLVSFFQSMQTKLLTYMNELETSGEADEYNPDNTQTDQWIKYQALPQDNNPVQKDKNTDRIQKIDIYDNNHMPMNRQQLGINNNFQVPVAQDTLNPNLENITSRFINLDSQFRQASGGSETLSTDYTMDLSDPLTNVLSLRLYSIQIPYTWYTIDDTNGNTKLWLTNKGNTFEISIEPGNYNGNELCSMLTNKFKELGFTYPTSPSPNNPDIARFNSNNAKLTIYLGGWTDPSGNTIQTITQYTDIFDSTKDAYFTFFDMNNVSCFSQTNTFDSTLGWLMGFRLPIQPIFNTTIGGVSPNFTYSGGNTSQSVVNLYGTKYFIVVLDDYNQNHINNGLISITELSKSLALPSYYNTSQPYVCTSNVSADIDINEIGNLSNKSPAELTSLGINPDNIFNTLQDKIDMGTGKVQQILPSAPRTLTQAQIYTINEIIKARNKTISFRAKAPTNSDTFAIIPIKYGSMSTGQLYTELSGQFQDNKRIYFGPVNIDRLRIRLLDDKGNNVNLHGADWCVTIISENLYQY